MPIHTVIVTIVHTIHCNIFDISHFQNYFSVLSKLFVKLSMIFRHTEDNMNIEVHPHLNLLHQPLSFDDISSRSFTNLIRNKENCFQQLLEAEVTLQYTIVVDN